MSNLGMMLDRVQDATLRGGDGHRDQIRDDINQAIKQVDMLVRPQLVTALVVVTAGQSDYSLSQDFLITDLTSIRDVVYASASGVPPWRLYERSPSDIREMRRASPAASWIYVYATDGLDLLMLYPNTQSVGDQITIYYVPRSVTLVDDWDVPIGLPEEWHDLYELAAIRRCMRQSSPEYALHYVQLFQQTLGEYRKWRNGRSGGRSRIVVPGPLKVMLPHDPSTDLRGYR